MVFVIHSASSKVSSFEGFNIFANFSNLLRIKVGWWILLEVFLEGVLSFLQLLDDVINVFVDAAITIGDSRRLMVSHDDSEVMVMG